MAAFLSAMAKRPFLPGRSAPGVRDYSNNLPPFRHAPNMPWIDASANRKMQPDSVEPAIAIA
jgi:hypothetical protein